MIQREQLNASIRDIEIPRRMLTRPVTSKGYPVPFFAAKNREGEWDFRVVYPETVITCIKRSWCWMCGCPLGIHKAFVTGPMCVVTGTSAEPPCHLDCARYAAIACPFLSQPRMRRNDKNMPEGHRAPPGIGIMRNPGVAAVYVTREFRPFVVDDDRILIRMGSPEMVQWYAQKRAATRSEVADSIASSLVLLFSETPRSEHDEIRQKVNAAMRLLPYEGSTEERV